MTAPFRQSTVTRAVKAVRAAGVGVERVEVEPSGKIVILTTSIEKPDTDDQALDQWVKRNGARQG